MITIKENTILVGVSEFRKGIERILAKARTGLIVIEKRHKPTAVLMSNKEYEYMENIVETTEDIVLEAVANERYSKAKGNDYIDIEKLL